ncbi:hypothetical protein MBLNU230_g1240t1 [Neophaeotheca triangularis]
MSVKSLLTASACLGLVTSLPSEPTGNERRQLFGSIGSIIGDALGTLGSLASGIVARDQTFDYVIVGAGNAGIPLAYRLSEDPSVSVALVEAGSFYQVTNPALSSTPAGDVIFSGSDPSDTNPLVDWGFVTEPQAGASNREVSYARGKCLGGSSARNYMIYQRPTVASLQRWADDVNDQSYTFENMLPYYKKGMQFTPPDTSRRASNATAEYNPGSFDSSGPGQVSYANYAQTFSSYMEGGLNAIGMSKRNGFNDGELMGTAYCTSTIDPSTQRRASSQVTYLNAAQSQRRRNLKVFSLTTAKRILFNSDKRATGVRVAGTRQFTLNARREVILSAGVFQSPQLLMVSGIGPADQLNSLGIDIVHENANVGQNMWDHVFAGPTFQVALETLTRIATDPVYLAAKFVDYNLRKRGPLTNPVSDFLGWEKVPANLRSQLSDRARADLDSFPGDWPDIEYVSGAGYIGDFGNLLLDQPRNGLPPYRQYATILSTIVAPLSRGNVSIVSDDTSDLPSINPNWLTHPTDQEVAVAAFKRARQAFATDFMQQTTVGAEYFPGPEVQTDAQILKNYQDTLMTVWHAACTCKMGAADDPTAVVDSKARVMGVQGLRVVDASAFNLLPPGHPMSTVYALAEKIADDIKNGS